MATTKRQQKKLVLFQRHKRIKKLPWHGLSLFLMFIASIVTYIISLPILSHDILASNQRNKENYDNTATPARKKIDTLLYPRTNHSDTKTRMLWGIYTTLNSDIEAQRRKIVRNTYLKCDTVKICPIHKISPDCIVIYTFVVGANTDDNGSTMLLQPNDTFPMIIDPPQSEITEKRNNVKMRCRSRQSFHKKSTPLVAEVAPDIVYLNIKENLKQGKSDTWFKYATILEQELNANITFPFTIDYVAKVDTDTVIYSMEYLHMIQHHLPKNPIRYYGGMLNFRQIYEGIPETINLMHYLRIGPTYMHGSIYFMSMDLANFITSDDCHREKLRVFSEDFSIGNFVQSHPLGVTQFQIGFDEAWYHPVKDVNEFVREWRDHSYHCPNKTTTTSETRIFSQSVLPYNFTSANFSIEYYKAKPATLASLQDENSEYISYYHPIHYNGEGK